MIAGENQIRFLERVRHVVGGVSRRRQRFDGPAVAGHHTAVGERDVRTKIEIGTGVEPAASPT